jgi:hypothetical protein
MSVRTLVPVMVFVALAIVACSLPGEARSVDETRFQHSEPVGACPTATTGTQLLQNKDHGYCLLYPQEFAAANPNPNETILYIGSQLNFEQAHAYIDVQEAGSLTATQTADKLEADVQAAIPGFAIMRSTLTLDGQEAVVLDNLPGQEISRQVIVVHKTQVYKLTFMPADKTMGDAYQQMESLYATVTGSFSFWD